MFLPRTLLAWFVLAVSALAADWPQFRGPAGTGLTAERDLPLKWDGKTGEGIAWRVPLPKSDNGWSSPIVAGGKVIVTCVENQPVTHRVLCFEAKDGRKVWESTVAPGPWLLRDLRGGYGAPTPCSDGQRVYVVFGSAVIAALNLADGKEVWRKDLEHYAFDVALGASPVLFGANLLLDGDQTGKTSSIIAFDRATGEKRWEAPRPESGFTHCTPVLATVEGRPQMFVASSQALQGLDPTDGHVLWWCPTPGDASSPAYDGQVIYSDSGRGGKGVCVDPRGTGDISATPHRHWVFPQISEGLGSPVIAGGLVWRAHNPEILKAIRVSDGTVAFSERLSGVPTYASPFATADGRVYLASAGKTYVLRVGETLEVLATNDLGEENRASAAVSNGHIFLRGNKTLTCLGPK